LEGQNLAAQRRAEASAYVAHEDVRQPDPFSVVLGTASGSTSQALNQYRAGVSLPQFGTEPPSAAQYAQLGLGQGQLATNQAGLQLQAQQYANQLALMQQYFPLMMGMS
jgi:hypothetical protein